MGQRTRIGVVLLSGILSTVACYFAPFHQHYQWVAWCLWGFLCGGVLPIGITIALGESPTRWGLTVGDWRLGGLGVVFGLLVMLPVGFWVAPRPEFQSYYAPLVDQYRAAPGLFWLALFAYMVGWEFLFRGFLLFGLAGDTRNQKFETRNLQLTLAIAVSTLLFGASHYGKPPLEVFGSFLAGVVLCLLAWRTRSCLAPIALHTFVFGMFVLQTGGQM